MKDVTRREFLQWTGAAAAAGAIGSQAAPQPGGAPTGGANARRPNVLLILTDDQGWGDIHSHGNDKLDTPVMDSLAAAGARFDRFYVCPLCAPTRSSLLTGRYHWRCGVDGVTRGKEIMRADEVTIAQVLKPAGYATGCFGKWHNGSYWPFHPNAKGFDEFFGFCAGNWTNYFDTTLQRNGQDVPTKGYITDVLTDAAIDFMRANRDRPFFAYVPYNAPHTPHQVPDRYFDKYAARGFDAHNACIYGMVENLDDNLGRLLKTLDELKLAEDTVVIFLTDNGPNGARFNGGMAGIKGSNSEGGCRVPCFVRWPGHVPPGATIKQIAAHIDLLPTIAAIAGAANPKTLPLDGKDLTCLLLGKPGNWPDRMLFEKNAVRTQRWRLQTGGGGRGKNAKPGKAPAEAKITGQLFDMDADPGQSIDVAAEHPEVAARLHAAYEAWWADVSKGLKGMPPPLPVGYEQMPVVTLLAPEAGMTGKVHFMQGNGWAHDWLVNWVDPADRIWWDIDVAAAGKYRAELLYCCPPADVGAKVRLEAAGNALDGAVAKAHDPACLPSPDRVKRKEVYEKTWATLELGVLDLPAGPTRLTVSAATIPGRQAMELKAARLTRLGPGGA
jgi:arylsulfatase A